MISIMSKEIQIVLSSIGRTQKRIALVDRSIQIYKDFRSGKLTKLEYEVLQNTTLSEIRQLQREEKEENGKEKEEEAIHKEDLT